MANFSEKYRLFFVQTIYKEINKMDVYFNIDKLVEVIKNAEGIKPELHEHDFGTFKTSIADHIHSVIKEYSKYTSGMEYNISWARKTKFGDRDIQWQWVLEQVAKRKTFSEEEILTTLKEKNLNAAEEFVPKILDTFRNEKKWIKYGKGSLDEQITQLFYTENKEFIKSLNTNKENLGKSTTPQEYLSK